MEAIKVIHRRASLKACLSGKKIDKADLIEIFNAARSAPSGKNQQPTRLFVVTDEALIKKLASEAFSEGNAMVGQAPVLIFVCANPKDAIARDGQNYYLFDAGLAMENLLLAATDLGLATHVMTGYRESEVKRILGIPEEVRVVAATPLACPPQKSYEEAAKDRLAGRTRKGLQEIAFLNTWGKGLA